MTLYGVNSDVNVEYPIKLHKMIKIVELQFLATQDSYKIIVKCCRMGGSFLCLLGYKTG